MTPTFSPSNPYYGQARLAVGVLRFVADEGVFALKGGTAINLFYRDLPRLSVDLDLTYLPVEDRKESFAAIEDALLRIARVVEKSMRGARVHVGAADKGKLNVLHENARIKVEVAINLRGSVHAPMRMDARPAVMDQFGDIVANVLAFPDLYAGKLVAALDRQHPRDLFDVRLLLADQGFTPELLDAFVIYLASHDRPIAEVLAPAERDIRDLYDGEFAEMAADPVSYEALLDTRREMIERLHASLESRHLAFLRSVKQGEPDWGTLPYAHAMGLPGIQWKLHNVRKLQAEKPDRHAELLANLDQVLERISR